MMAATANRQSLRHSGRKVSLMATCGNAALAVGLTLGLLVLPESARADAFNATPTVVQGTVTIDRMVPGQDTIIVTGLDAVVDWQPTEISGTTLTFLPNGNTAIFQGTPGATDFAIINRILPSTDLVAPQFDGQVISRLMVVTAPAGPGGTVMFYSASGLAIGPSAVFDVGRLFLSSLDPDITTFDEYLAGTGPLLFSGGTGRVDLASGSQINAPGEGSYFVVTAPEMAISSNATINGSVAYIAGQGVSLTYDAGLFDIAVTLGTTSSQPITHFGTTGGPASTGATDPHVIYGVARGQLNPFEMLFGGNLGFDPAVSAAVENGVVVLSGNYNVSGTSVLNDFTIGSVTSGSEADLLIDGATITSDVIAHSSNFAQINAIDQTTDITGDVFLFGRVTSQITAEVAGLVDIIGDVVVSANAVGVTTTNANSPSFLDASAGLAEITASPDGAVSITGNASVLAIGQMGFDNGTNVAGNAAGGVAEVRALGGIVDITGTLLIDASATAPVDSLTFNSGGFADGGLAFLLSDSGGTLTVGSNVDVLANGSAYAIRGAGDSNPVGEGQGGAVLVQAAGGSQMDLRGNLFLASDGAGSDSAVTGGVAGAGYGGSTRLEVINGLSSITVDGTLTAQANAEGGLADSGTGGLADAGNVSVTLGEGAAPLIATGLTTLSSLAFGGEGDSGGDAASGNVTISLQSADFTTAGLIASGSATGGLGSAAGSGLGGTVLLEVINGAGLVSTGDVSLTSVGTSLDTGTATGGIAQLVVQGPGSTLEAPSLTVVADADVPATGTGTAGTFLIDVLDGGSLLTNTLSASALDRNDPTPETSDSRLQALLGGQISVLDSATVIGSGNVALNTSSGGQIVGGTTTADLTALFNLVANNELSFTGDNASLPAVAADFLSLSSRDIAIAPDVQLFAPAVSITALGGQDRAVLGGSTQEAGYTLVQAEFDRIQTGSISFLAFAGTAAYDLEVRDLAIQGSLLPGGTADLSIYADGNMLVTGLVDYRAVASTDQLFVAAGNTLEIVLPGGGFSMLDGNTTDPGLAGTLGLAARSLFAADANLLGLIGSDPASATLGPLLLGSGTNTVDGSFIFADTVEITAGDHILTQNTGVGADMSGIVVGPGGLSIRREGDFGQGTMRVITFGARDNGDGTFALNDDFFATVNFNSTVPANSYTTDATLNECNIITAACPSPPPPPPSEPEFDLPLTIRDRTEVPDEGVSLAAVNRAQADAAFGVEFSSTIQVPEGDDQGLVTDPVTSGGDHAPTPAEEDE
jgi:hypothetical protein